MCEFFICNMNLDQFPLFYITLEIFHSHVDKVEMILIPVITLKQTLEVHF